MEVFIIYIIYSIYQLFILENVFLQRRILTTNSNISQVTLPSNEQLYENTGAIKLNDKSGTKIKFNVLMMKDVMF